MMAPLLLMAQDKNDYTRSSLHLHLVDDFSFESGDYVLRSYEKFHKDHFPENYNNHSIDLNKIRLENWQLSEEEMAAAGKSNNALGNAMSQSASDATGGALKIQDNSMVKLQLDKYIAEVIKRNISGANGFSIVEFNTIGGFMAHDVHNDKLVASKYSITIELDSNCVTGIFNY